MALQGRRVDGFRCIRACALVNPLERVWIAARQSGTVVRNGLNPLTFQVSREWTMSDRSWPPPSERAKRYREQAEWADEQAARTTGDTRRGYQRLAEQWRK